MQWNGMRLYGKCLRHSRGLYAHLKDHMDTSQGPKGIPKKYNAKTDPSRVTGPKATSDPHHAYTIAKITRWLTESMLAEAFDCQCDL